MNPLVRPRRHGARCTLVALAGLLLLAPSAPAAGQDVPVCDGPAASDCRLAAWPTGENATSPSLFGAIEPVAWIEDEAGDAPEGGLDVLATGIGRVDIDEPGPIRSSQALLKRGKAKQAVPAGEAVLVRVVLDRPPQEAEAGHASVHVATDVNGSRTSNVPSGVSDPDFPFAGSQDVYSLTWASTTGKTRLLNSDLAKAWYEGKEPFAASWATPTVLDLLFAPSAVGEGLRVVAHTAGRSGGYDTLALGPAPLPVDGAVGLIPSCLEASISTQPFVVRRLVESGQTVRNVETPSSWRGGATFPLSEAARSALETLILERDDDADGRIGLQAWVNLFENGMVIRQRPELQIGLDGDAAQLSLELGLTRRGFNVLRDVEFESTGDDQLDTWLERATDAVRETMPPFRLGKQSGRLLGSAIGGCAPWIEPDPDPAATAESATPPAPDA